MIHIMPKQEFLEDMKYDMLDEVNASVDTSILSEELTEGFTIFDV